METTDTVEAAIELCTREDRHGLFFLDAEGAAGHQCPNCGDPPAYFGRVFNGVNCHPQDRHHVILMVNPDTNKVMLMHETCWLKTALDHVISKLL